MSILVLQAGSQFVLEGRGSMTSQCTDEELAPSMLWGKSPCRWAESASRRLQGSAFTCATMLLAELPMESWILSQHHSHVMSVRLRTLTGRGSLSPCLPSGKVMLQKLMSFEYGLVFE